MDTQIQRSNSSSGVHVCRKCGWPFPKPHPSSRHRRAHKKVCGSIEGYSRVAYADGVLSDDDCKVETLTHGSKSVEKSTRRGGSEEEMFADAVTEFADVNVASGDAGNLCAPSSANGAQALTPEREGVGIDTPLQQNLSGSSVDSVPSTGSDPIEVEKSDCKSKEVADEKRFGFDGKIIFSEKSLQATGDANEETGRRLETFTSCNDSFQNAVETDHLLLREHSVVVLEGSEDQRTEIGETVDSSEALQDPKLAEESSVEKKGEEAQQNAVLMDASARNFLDDIDSLAKSMKGVRPESENVEYDHNDAGIYDAVEPEADDDVLLESKDAIHVENDVLKNHQESEAGKNDVSGTDDDVDSEQSITIAEGRDLDQRKQEETVAAVGIRVDSGLIEEEGRNFGFVDGDTNLVNENLSESAVGTRVDSLESEDTVQESEAANDAISGTSDNLDSTQSLAITEERDLDQGKREETVAGSNGETHSIEENEGIISGLTDGDVSHMKEEETVSTFDNVKADSNRDVNLVKHEENGTVSALDVQDDASSQTNSLEGGSVSAATETESRPPQAPAKVETPVFPPGSENDKQEALLFKPNGDESGRNQGPTEAQTPQIPPGSKNNEEIGAEKRHMPLKSFLGDESSPPRKTPAKEAGQEWNSPARYPTNIKREKRKGKSRAWVPFICCSSSAQAS